VWTAEVLFQDDQDQSASEPRERVRLQRVRRPRIQPANRRRESRQRCADFIQICLFISLDYFERDARMLTGQAGTPKLI